MLYGEGCDLPIKSLPMDFNFLVKNKRIDTGREGRVIKTSLRRLASKVLNEPLTLMSEDDPTNKLFSGTLRGQQAPI